MPRVPLIVLVVTLAISGTASAQGDKLAPTQAGRAAFAEGKKLLDQGQDARAIFLQAMKLFGQRDKTSPISTERFQNLGNAAFLGDELPIAILAFRNGLFYDRHHPVLRENLAYARSQVRYPQNSERGRPEPDAWPWWLPRWRVIGHLGAGVAAYCVAWLALTAFLLVRRILFATVAVACFAVAATAGYACHLISAQWQMDVKFPMLVIQYDGVPLHTGNGESYAHHAELPTLARGMEARQLSGRGGWLQIQFSSGEIGWVRSQDVLNSVDLSLDSSLWR